jgi:Caspase domain
MRCSRIQSGSRRDSSIYFIEVLEKGDNRTSIIILDACRNNPYERRWKRGGALGLAPVYAPKGTIIAFATSPGETAYDDNGSNGAFTSALLSHISKQDLTIEDLFKRVRNTLSAMTSGKQTSWEHTSLMGDFYFNPSLPAGEFVTEYSPVAKADSRFHISGSYLRDIINGLKSHTWDLQNSAMSDLPSVDWNRCKKDDLFVLGRNIYQAACGDSRAAKAYLEDLPIYELQLLTA